MIIKAEISEIVYFREYKSEYTTVMLEKAKIKIKKWRLQERENKTRFERTVLWNQYFLKNYQKK